MNLVLDLPSELQAELATEAARFGLSLSEYVLRLIVAARRPGPALHGGADLLGYWRAEGLIGTRPDISDSQAHARAVREQAERRRRE
jgi:hypothetical protein